MRPILETLRYIRTQCVDRVRLIWFFLSKYLKQWDTIVYLIFIKVTWYWVAFVLIWYQFRQLSTLVPVCAISHTTPIGLQIKYRLRCVWVYHGNFRKLVRVFHQNPWNGSDKISQTLEGTMSVCMVYEYRIWKTCAMSFKVAVIVILNLQVWNFTVRLLSNIWTTSRLCQEPHSVKS